MVVVLYPSNPPKKGNSCWNLENCFQSATKYAVVAVVVVVLCIANHTRRVSKMKCENEMCGAVHHRPLAPFQKGTRSLFRQKRHFLRHVAAKHTVGLLLYPQRQR